MNLITFLKRKLVVCTLLLTLGAANNFFAMENNQENENKQNGFELVDEIDLEHKGCKAISPDSKYIASGSEDGQVIVYNLTTKEQISYQHNDTVRCIAFSRCGNYVASGSYDEKVFVYNLTTKEKQISYQHNHLVWCIAFSRCGNYVASGSGDGQVIVYNLTTKEKQISYQHNSNVECIAFSRCGNYVASGSGSEDGEVIVYNLTTKEQISYQHNGDVECIAFSRCGNYVASGSYKKVIVYNLTTKEQISYQHNGLVNCIAFSRCGNYVASGSRDKKVIVYNLATKKQISYQHNDWVECIAFSRCENYVASGSADRQVIVYNLATKEQISYQHNNYVWCIAFSQDGKRLISVDYDGQVQVRQTPVRCWKEDPLAQEDLKERVEYLKDCFLDEKDATLTKNTTFTINFRDLLKTKLQVNKIFLGDIDTFREEHRQKAQQNYEEAKLRKIQEKEWENGIRGTIITRVNSNKFLVQLETEKESVECECPFIPQFVDHLKEGTKILANKKNKTILGYVINNKNQ